MTPVQLTQGFAATKSLEAAHENSHYEMTYYLDAPLAVGTANAEGSYLVTAEARQLRKGVLLSDMVYVAEEFYVNDTTRISCQQGRTTEAEVRGALGTADTIASHQRNLIIVNNLEELIGHGDTQPTRLQHFAISTLYRWTTGRDIDTGYTGQYPNQAKRNVCATMCHPDYYTHPLRAALISSFAGKHSLVGSIHMLSSVPETEKSKVALEPANQAVAA